MYVLIDVGCLECVIDTELLGVYADRDEAMKAFDQAAIDRGLENRWTTDSRVMGYQGDTLVVGAGYDGNQHSLELHTTSGTTK